MRREEEGKAAVGSIVVAVDGEHKASQYALKWAVDRLLHRDTSADRSIILLNVSHSSPIMSFRNSDPAPYCSNTAHEREPDDREMEVLSPFRGFCTRRQIQFEVVVVEDDDVAQALVDYSIRHRVANLLMGAPSKKKAFCRLLKPRSGIARTVVKWIPDFCSVYIISKLGKLKNVRNADHPTPPLHHNTTNHHILGVSTRGRRGGPKSDGFDDDIFSERETFEFGVFPSSATSSPCTSDTILLSPSHDFEYTSLLLTQKLESMEDDMKRLKLDHNQTADVYRVACKQALPPNKMMLVTQKDNNI